MEKRKESENSVKGDEMTANYEEMKKLVESIDWLEFIKRFEGSSDE